ncbi:MAG: IS3 family transposase [Bacteroidaceae bacterium]|nr:IS3 family transposase [Bacteroidaceae bacterium]
MLCGLFGKTRQAYYRRLNYRYIEMATEEIVLSLVYKYRSEMGRIGCRKLQHLINSRLPSDMHIGRDALYSLLERNSLLHHRRRRTTRTTWSNHWMHKYPNLICDIVPTASNQIWVSDITYIETQNEGFVYLHLVTDLYSRKIMGWNLSPTLHAEYTLQALKMAIRNAGCSLSGLIHHSDRGCQYCCERYVSLLKEQGIMISMTQSGDPLENSVAERVNGIIKDEWLTHETVIDSNAAVKRISEIVNIYNNVRPHASLDYMTPNDAYRETGLIKRRWKNCYSSGNYNNEDVITLLTR